MSKPLRRRRPSYVYPLLLDEEWIRALTRLCLELALPHLVVGGGLLAAVLTTRLRKRGLNVVWVHPRSGLILPTDVGPTYRTVPLTSEERTRLSRYLDLTEQRLYEVEIGLFSGDGDGGYVLLNYANRKWDTTLDVTRWEHCEDHVVLYGIEGRIAGRSLYLADEWDPHLLLTLLGLSRLECEEGVLFRAGGCAHIDGESTCCDCRSAVDSRRTVDWPHVDEARQWENVISPLLLPPSADRYRDALLWADSL